MPRKTPDKPPAGLKAPGRRLWADLLGQYDLDPHEMALLLEAARTADVLDDLAQVVVADGLMVDGSRGRVVHPAAVEARQLRITLARLLVALRIPSEDSGDRSQRRGVRGVYGVPA